MRKIHLLALGSLLFAAPLAAQSWYPAFGVSAGLTRFRLTGTKGAGGTFDQFDVPGSSLLSILPAPGALFAIIPVADKVALEPTLGLQQVTISGAAGGVPASVIGLGLRGDYALTNHIYGAAGIQAGYIERTPAVAFSGTSLGLQLAAGYRFALTSRLDGRVEAQATTFKKTDFTPPYNAYSLLFGLSTRLEGSRAPARGSARSEAPAGDWQPMIGVTGGYTHSHVNHGPDITAFSLPSLGGSGAVGAILAPTAPSLFVILPVGGRWAFETGADFHQLRSDGLTLSSFQLAPRMDFAVGPHWYAAAGPEAHFLRIKQGPGASKTQGIVGLAAAWGIRFHVAGALAGRIELGFGSGKVRKNVPAPSAVNSLSINFGATMPLK